jgi:chitinase
MTIRLSWLWRTASCVMVLILALCSVVSNAASAPKRKHKLIGYVAGRTDMYRIGAEKLTHVNYAFALVSPEGELMFRNPNAPAHLSQLQALKARNPALRIIVSVGGWGADNFSDAALSDESRDKFAKSVVDLVKRYALDGIDLDWEYPGQPGPGIKYRAEDRENFTLLLKTIRQQLDALSVERKRSGPDHYTLTIASTNGRYFEHTEMKKLHVYLDWINIMTYDFYTRGSKTTGHHTGLHASSGGDPNRNTEASVKQHLAAGIPPEKLVIGAAFYGRGWAGAKTNGVNQPFEKYAGEFSYSTLARDYLDRQGFKRLWDRVARAPYLWNAETATLISYDDPASLKEKAAFVKKHHLGGVMYWEHSHDPGETLLNALFQSLR